jgi:hypothetical protein
MAQDRLKRAYHFFLQAAEEQQVITFADILQATRYTTGTLRIYIAQKWGWFLTPDADGYRVAGLQGHTFEEFASLHKQHLNARTYQITVTLPPSLASWLKQQADQEGRSATDLVVEALERYRDIH